jgi:hypothetical protein
LRNLNAAFFIEAFLKASISMSQEKLMISNDKQHLIDQIPFDIVLDIK